MRRCEPWLVHLLAAVATLAACGGGDRSSPPATLVARAPTPAPATPAPSTESSAPAATPAAPIVFRGMCDASGAVPLGGSLFAVADDEDNVLRVYDAHAGGDPVASVDVSTALGLAKPTTETDIEAATRVGDVAYWLTSHGRNRKGKLKPARLRFFVTSTPADGVGLAPQGQPYLGLLDDLLAVPAMARFGLDVAATLPPKAPGGLNIEGLVAAPDRDELLIGFRSPVPDGLALVVPLLNPAALTQRGGPAQFGAPLQLDLGGLGVRDMVRWGGDIVIAAGEETPSEPPRPTQLYRWDGVGAPAHLAGIALDGLNPEAFVAFVDELLVISDDGNVLHGDVPCKQLENHAAKQFRAVWVKVP